MTAVKRILIVRPSALGDVCRTVPALVTLRRAHPDAHIDWLVNDDFADAIVHHPDLTGVVPFPRKRFAAMWRSPAVLRDFVAWSRRLKSGNFGGSGEAGGGGGGDSGGGGGPYDLAFDLQGLFRSGILTRLSGARRRVGFANARELGWLGYNGTYRIDPNLHTVDLMMALLSADGYALHHDMKLHLGDEQKQWALTKYGEPFVCLAPTAKWQCKCWPIDRYVEIGRRLAASGKRVVILAAPHERCVVQPLIDEGFTCPQTSVAQLCALVARCDLLVCNDSAPLHIAVGFDRPVVTIFGPTDPASVGPYRRDDAVIQPQGVTAADMSRYRKHSDQTLIAQVTIEQVWQRIEFLVD